MMLKLPDFPKDVLFEIMSRMPPDSLILFKLLSKSWYALIKSLINDPSFVAKHLQNMKNDMSFSTSLAFLCWGPCTCTSGGLELRHSPSCYDKELVYLLALFHDDGENDHIHHVSKYFNLPLIPGRRDMCETIGYHCNGIICLASNITGYQNRIIFCNPAIKDFRLLPEPELLDDFIILARGLGYDSRAKTYKFVIFGFNSKVPNNQAKIYSLDTNAWREIALPFHIYFDLLYDNVIHCEGVLYSPVIAPGTGYKILSFDLSNEVFHLLPLPDNLQTLVEVKWRLLVWNETVALLASHRLGEGLLSIQIWVMDDYIGSVKGSCSWIKKLTVGPLVGLGRPLTLCQDELLMEGNNGGLMSYNLRTKKLRNLAINGVAGTPCWVFTYVQSLVSVKIGCWLSHRDSSVLELVNLKI